MYTDSWLHTKLLIITKPEKLSVIVHGHYVARELESIVEFLRQAIDINIPR